MTSTLELDRPITTSGHPRRRRWLIGLTATAGALLTTVATTGAYVLSHAGNEPLATGAHTVEVYTVEDSISTVVAPADRPGVLGRFIGMCDADTYYMEVGGAGQCLVLNGSLGTVRATGTTDGVELDATEATRLRGLVQRDDAGNQQRSTRVVLAYDGGWAGLIKVADLRPGSPATGRIIG
ncbi:hypothetical protein [Actinoplanes sp. NPDC026619]|uniref:hypothetical protein n=1 Tax=Actinoplanes sp. NPDC026619 TaxID=3155798 RepID=UPI0033D7F571